MLRLFALLCLCCAGPATAWEFSAQPVCTLSDARDALSVKVTYDPRQAQPYAIALTQSGAAWPVAPLFAIRFDGPRGLTITTDKHVLSGDGRTLTVRDRGFGNVLDGLEHNSTATALAGGAEFPVSLDGAAAEVQKFRACTEGGLA